MAVHSIENPVGTMQVPLGVARNFVINGVKRSILMATEEATVVAGASKAAKLCVSENGFGAVANRAAFSAQVLYAPQHESEGPDVGSRISAALKDIRLDTVAYVQNHSTHGREVWVTEPRFVHGTRRNSANDVVPRTLVVVEVTIADTQEAMGANMAIRAGMQAARSIEERLGLKATSVSPINADAGRMTSAWATFDVPGGWQQRDAILDLHLLAEQDADRAVTHNKGVMNAVSAVALATGQDVRAIEAAAHKHAGRGTGYRPLTSYLPVGANRIRGGISLPLPVGTVGGATRGEQAMANMRLMDVRDADDLARVMAAAGLAQNFAALLSLTGEGIIEAHRRVRRPRP